MTCWVGWNGVKNASSRELTPIDGKKSIGSWRGAWIKYPRSVRPYDKLLTSSNPFNTGTGSCRFLRPMKTKKVGLEYRMVQINPRGRNTLSCLSGLLSPEAGCVGGTKDLTNEKECLGQSVML